MPKLTTLKRAAVAFAAAGAALTVAACTDAERAGINNYIGATDARVTCYSGPRLIYDGFSTGKVRSSTDSDGYEFVDQDTNRLMELSGNCNIDYGAPRAADFQRVSSHNSMQPR